METAAAPVHTDVDVETVLASLARDSAGALLVIPDTFTTAHRQAIIRLAETYRVPAIYPLRLFAYDGGLMAYGDDLNDQYRGAATYVDRILKGAKPADLPVQEPSKYQLVINLKTAKALDLNVPLGLTAGADEVIE
jgi:putative tryptophan/tyrosine transport system substrate-binding protein